MTKDRYPFQELLDYHITDWTAERCTVELTLQPKHANLHGAPHGGVSFTLLDVAMSFAGCFVPDAPRRSCVTLSLTTNYVAPSTGRRLIATAKKSGGGRKTFFAEGQVHDDMGLLIATATGAFRYIST